MVRHNKAVTGELEAIIQARIARTRYKEQFTSIVSEIPDVELAGSSASLLGKLSVRLERLCALDVDDAVVMQENDKPTSAGKCALITFEMKGVEVELEKKLLHPGAIPTYAIRLGDEVLLKLDHEIMFDLLDPLQDTDSQRGQMVALLQGAAIIESLEKANVVARSVE